MGKQREIKFRAWIKPKKKMAFVDSIKNLNAPDDHAFKSIYTEEWDTFHWKDVILMQYTGLKDKNGVEIYESDIVRQADGLVLLVKFEKYNGLVFWYKDGEDEDFYDLSIHDQVEIIGNTYENPEINI